MAVTIGFIGDTMLGRNVGDAVAADPTVELVGRDVVAAAQQADLLVANLECCLSTRGMRWPDPLKTFFFRGPPQAVSTLEALGVDVVTLANNHALDYGPEALLDTIELLRTRGMTVVGAGADQAEARAPAVLDVAGVRIGVVACADHPDDFEAGPDRPGIAYAPLETESATWVSDAVAPLRDEVDVVVVTPHWGPNMTSGPVPHVVQAAGRFVAAGADLVAGHSAHVFHGVEFVPHADRRPTAVLYDLGDFLDDYAVDPRYRNDLGLLWLVTVDGGAPDVTAFPLKLDYCHTTAATGDDRVWILRRLERACAPFAVTVTDDGRWLRLRPPS